MLTEELHSPQEVAAMRQQLARLQRLRQLKAREAGEDRDEAIRYLHDPAGWIARYLLTQPGRGLTGYQNEIVTELAKRRRAAVRGPHGLGKTMLASSVVLWFAITREQAGIDWKVLTTASAWRHLSVYLWPEIKKWARGLDWEGLNREPFRERDELLDLNLKQRYGAASAVASSKPELIEGAHADSLLYILDEAKIIPDATWDAVEGAFSGGQMTGFPEAYALAISTPGPPRGRFYDIHRRKPGLEDWWVRHVKVEEAIAAGRISREWVDQRRKQWGANSSRFANRVLGEFYEDETDALIPLSWIEAAIERWYAWDEAGRPPIPGKRVRGVDVARSGSDSTIVSNRMGPVIVELTPYEQQDTMATAARVQSLLLPAGRGGTTATPDEEDGQKGIGVVDTIGVGAGVYDRLREQRLAVLPYTGSARTKMKDRSGEYGFTNCLTGDARVQPIGELLRVYRSRYQGPLFRVKTASGDDFTATAHHQVLTLRGWVSVESLNAGDKICDARGVKPAPPLAEPQIDHVPPSLSEVYGACDRLFGAERMQGTAVDFHGDRPVGEVDVVTVDRGLLAVRPIGRQQTKDRALIFSLLGQRLLADGCHTHNSGMEGHRARGMAPRFPDGGVIARSGPALLHSQRVLGGTVGFKHGAQRDTLSPERIPDELLRHADVPGDVLDGHAAQVASRDVFGVGHAKTASRDGLGQIPELDAAAGQNPPNRVGVDEEVAAQSADRLALSVSADQSILIDPDSHGESRRLGGAPWLDAAFKQEQAQPAPISPVELAERIERLAAQIPLDEVASVEVCPLPDSHAALPFVYTMQTSTGAYASQSTTHRNCRSAAYWNLRELLDPAFDSPLMLPDDDLLVSDLTAPTYAYISGVPPKIQVEQKDKVSEKLGRSPDRGDAVAMAYFLEQLRRDAEVGQARGALPTKPMSPLGRVGAPTGGRSGMGPLG